jgi:hypothetical protein
VGAQPAVISGLVRLRGHRRALAAVCAVLLLVFVAVALTPRSAAAADPCNPVVSPVACENTLPGTPASQWDVGPNGGSTISGFTTDMSVNRGSTVQFKIKTNATKYRLDIYRMGYYGGNGARLITTFAPSATLPQTQPNCLGDATTGLVDCGNWAVSASWNVPSTAVSGVYFADLVRTDGTSDAGMVVFVVRDDASHSAVVMQTSDATWQAYNTYGGNSLYTGSPAGRAYKVSYNRPFTTRSTGNEDFVFRAEYPMIRFLESNGYDVSYTSEVDTDRAGSLLRNHKTFLSVGHDEYWSGQERANVEAARDAGVNLAFFSGNEMFWKTRYEPSIDASHTAYRTLVCYKETHANQPIDPMDPPTWTGSWRDKRFSPPADGGRPENGVTGTLFFVNGSATRADSIKVPAADGKMRFWRGTTVATQAAGATATMPAGTLGYEWDTSPDNGSQPPGLVKLSTASYSLSSDYLLDNGSTYGAGTAVHNLTLYRASSGALVFGAGTVQWAWGLDAHHDGTGGAADVRMQQASVNLLADMGAQPATLVTGLTAATASTDTTAPVSTIATPANGGTVPVGSATTITGTAADTGGQVGGVEVSVDGGTTWHPATGRASWSYSWTPTAAGTATIRTRAVDDSGNLETPAPGITVTVGSGGGGPATCPCSLFPATAVPVVAADSDTAAVEVGVKFRSDVGGTVTGLRFYKGTGNTGTHVAHLWSATGTSLATATMSGESASGWQSVTFPAPVTISANTTYVASYYAPSGHYAADAGFFSSAGVDNPPLHALSDPAGGGDGVYRYGTGGGFPTLSFAASNYWVDVLFNTASGGGTDTTPPSVTAQSPAPGATGVPTSSAVRATFSEAVQPSSVTMTLTGPSGTVPGAVGLDAAGTTATFTPSAALAPGSTYSAAVSGARDIAGNVQTSPVSWSFATAAPAACPCSLFAATAAPVVSADPDTASVEVGVRFSSDVAGTVTGLRFYKGTGNTGTHVAHLWSSAGALLATATFVGESASGWQTVTFSAPVAITANTTYVASYVAPKGHYADDEGYFSTPTNRAPLHAPADAAGAPNGVYRYGTGGVFPTSSFNASNYWVDVTLSA